MRAGDDAREAGPPAPPPAPAVPVARLKSWWSHDQLCPTWVKLLGPHQVIGLSGRIRANTDRHRRAGASVQRLRRPPAPCPTDRGAADSKPETVSCLQPARNNLRSRRSHFVGARRPPETRARYQRGNPNNEVGHVGCHHQADLPPLVQELSGRRAQTAQTDQPLGLIAKPKRG
jgi:hypothetical protein